MSAQHTPERKARTLSPAHFRRGAAPLYNPTSEEIESLHGRFRRAAELLGHGTGAWKLTPNAVKAMVAAVDEFEAFRLRYITAAIAKATEGKS